MSQLSKNIQFSRNELEAIMKRRLNSKKVNSEKILDGKSVALVF